jgi:hypothetical protein
MIPFDRAMKNYKIELRERKINPFVKNRSIQHNFFFYEPGKKQLLFFAAMTSRQ